MSAWGRAAGAALAGVLLALPPVWAGPGGRGGPPRGGGGTGMEHPQQDPEEDFHRARKLLEGHPKFKRVWEKLTEEQRERCLKRIVQRLHERRKQLYEGMDGLPPAKRYERLKEKKRELKERIEKRRKDAENRRGP